jgi:hypothetical protein
MSNETLSAANNWNTCSLKTGIQRVIPMTEIRNWTVRQALSLLAGTVLAACVGRLEAQAFDVGSNGSLGDVVISENTTIDLPPDGKLHYKSLTVNSGVRVGFKRNVRNTPVVMLSQGDIVVNGTIDVGASDGTSNDGGAPGPGGFAGGKPGFGATPPGTGYGPGGGGLGNINTCDFGTRNGNGSFGGRGNSGPSGEPYGNVFLIPLIGGSGGAGGPGSPGRGGGGGGGAILLASNTKVRITGTINAQGGTDNGCAGGGGAGGGIRLVALRVDGSGLLDTRTRGSGGLGRIRVDTLERDGIAFSFQGVTSVGGNLFALPTVIPRLDTIEVAGTAFPEGSQPGTILLPFGSSPDRTVKIQARDFGKVIPIRITLTPDTGSKIVVDTEIDNSVNNPATVEVPVTFPVNSKVTVHCWTR